MSAEEMLRSNERSALENNQFITHVTGKVTSDKKHKKIGSLGALGFLTAMLIFFAVVFGSGNLIPSAISERLIEETDVQYADAVESKKLVFQQAMYNGDLPDNTIAILSQNGVEVESAENGEQVLKLDGRTVTASDFINVVKHDAKLYNAFDKATYSRAAYYFDDSAKKVFDKIGTTRNNYSKDSNFDEVMESMVGDGSRVSVNSVVAVESNQNGETYYDYENTGMAARASGEAIDFINEVGNKNTASSVTEATLNTADSLKTADTISKEQRSSLFFLVFMENISKMKAGEGNESKINEAMNYLYNAEESEVVDVETGEVVKTKGTALESPSLYAILSGNKVDNKLVNNYSSDRILKTIENRVGATDSQGAIDGTVASAGEKIKASIGRFLSSGAAGASYDDLAVVDKTIDSSLINNSYETIKGISAGEFLVEGAVNVGKELAKASGASPGDSQSALGYSRLNKEVLAMDAAADRLNRSPFDVTSKNTFLGSIIYNLAVASINSSKSLLGTVGTISATINSAAISLMPNSYADAIEGYLSGFGECETYGTIGAVGSPQCSEVATFDISTLDDPFNDAAFMEFVDANTTMGATGSRRVNKGSVLAEYILYNNERSTPLGVTDGGILNSLESGSRTVSFTSNIVAMIKRFLGASWGEKRIASGAAYVNSADNPDWQNYKYAQRYVSLARATESLRQYADDSNSYNNIRGFEGDQNPVAVFLEDYYARLER